MHLWRQSTSCGPRGSPAAECRQRSSHLTSTRLLPVSVSTSTTTVCSSHPLASSSRSRHSRHSRHLRPLHPPQATPRDVEEEGAAPLTKDDLVAWMASGCKPREKWRIGTEHEKLGFRLCDHRRMGLQEVEQLLGLLQRRHGWQPLMEGGHLLGVEKPGQGSVTLEPGGQLELSGAPLADLHHMCAELQQHLDLVKALGREVGVGFIGLGLDPASHLEEVPVVPKGQYLIMRDAFGTPAGRDIMYRTCTVQVNLDFSSEADMVAKMRVGLALQPVATALFANSPFKLGHPTGFRSTRSHMWDGFEPRRCGMLLWALEPGMGFERYVEWAAGAPLMFVYHKHTFVPVTSGASFADFMAGRLPELPGVYPTLADWSNHLGSLWPEVRVRRWMEMRGADAGPWRMVAALPALWTGLMYDEGALAEAQELVGGWSAQDIEQLRHEVPRTALHTPFKGVTVKDVAQRMVAIAQRGLAQRGLGEEVLLDQLATIAATGLCPADHLLALYQGPWAGDVGRAFEELHY